MTYRPGQKRGAAGTSLGGQFIGPKSIARALAKMAGQSSAMHRMAARDHGSRRHGGAVKPRTAAQKMTRAKAASVSPPETTVTTGTGVKLSVSYALRPYPGEAAPMHYWSAKDEHGAVVGELWADPDTGQIMQVQTPAHRRREGIATALFKTASKKVPLYHSPTEHRTSDGHGWVEAVGGNDIADHLAYHP